MENQVNANIFENFSEKHLEEILEKNNGILQVNCKLPIRDKSALSLVYSPGVGACCKQIEKDVIKAQKLTNKSNSIIIVTDTSSLNDSLNNSNLNESVLPYVESISCYYKIFCNIDCYPIIVDLALLDSDQDFIDTVDSIMPAYSLVELYEVKEVKYQLFVNHIKNKKVDFYNNYSIIGKSSKRKLDDEIRKILDFENIQKFYNINIEYLTSNFIYSCIIRSALDLQVYCELDSCVEYILKNLKENFECKNNPRYRANDKDEGDCILEFLIKHFSNSYNAMDYLIKISCEFLINKNKIIGNLAENKYPNHHKNMSINLLISNIRKNFYNFSVMGRSTWIEEYPSNYHQATKSINENSILLHWRYHGVIETGFKLHIREANIFTKIFSWKNLDYISNLIKENPSLANKLTYKSNYGAIITNGTAILGFGDIGALAGLPVMEGKSVLFKLFGGINITPICIQEKNPMKFISIVQKIAPSFSAINLEDIRAPDCFEIENNLIKKLTYPVFHDDQHGTAIVVLSGIINSLKLVNKNISDVKIVMNGAGAAGLSVCDLLLTYGARNIIVCDTSGAIYIDRKKNMNAFKKNLAGKTNLKQETGDLKEVLKNADIFIGVSAPKTLSKEMIKSMNNKPIIFALANPEPEIYPEEAYAAGAFIVATGRSDLKNQVNNSLAFPGIFRAAMDVKAPRITVEMKLNAAIAIADLINEYELNQEYIIPDSLDSRVPIAVAKAVAKKALELGISWQKDIIDDQVEDNLKGWLLEEKLKNWYRIKHNGSEFIGGILKHKF